MALTTGIETCIDISMYKRNQVEMAISAVLEQGVNQPGLGLRTRVKRLLDTDRALGCNRRSNVLENVNFAFFREAAPGSGFEVSFSAYDAFALLVGLQLMMHNWPQRFAVSVLRRVRLPLEKEYERILKLDPEILFDQKAIERSRVSGSAAFDTTAPAVLAICSHYQISREQEQAPYSCSVHSSLDSATNWISGTTKGVGGGASMFELTVVAHHLARALERTKPQPRGRTA
jgi:hypothetical protein